MREHHRFLITQHLAQLDFLDGQIATYSEEIERLTQPLDDRLVLLHTIPGVGRTTAELILAEVGSDVSRFPTPGALGGVVRGGPGYNESACKPYSGRTRRGSQRLRAGLVQAAKPLPGPKVAISQPSTIALRRGGDANVPWWPSCIQF